MLVRSAILIVVLIYISIFSVLDKTLQAKAPLLQRALPAKLQIVTTGYLRQLASEILFIKTSVFLGGINPGVPAATYAEPLANNFEVMTTLYPEFIDTYFFNQSYLAPISKKSAEKANRILDAGIEAYPKNYYFRFFQAYNYYSYMDLPLKAAEIFEKAAELPDAPPMFEHLAAVFSANGGNIFAGLVMLKTLLLAEEDGVVKERYREEIKIFEKALIVDNAIKLYSQNKGVAPEKLEDLVPVYLQRLPQISDHFVLIYEPPTLPYEHAILRLKRP